MPGTAQSGGKRRGKTLQEHQLAGTYRKERHEGLISPTPTAGRPDPPAELDELGQKTWERMIGHFDDMGMTHKVDAESLFAYCRLWSQTEQVGEQQSDARESLTRLEENSGDLHKMEPSERMAYFTHVVTLHKLISKCTDQGRSGWMAIRQYLVEFGLTPASRGRIKLPKPAETTDAFAAWQQKKGAA